MCSDNRLDTRRSINRNRFCALSENAIYYVCIFLVVFIMISQQKIHGLFMDDLGLLRGWQTRESLLSFLWNPNSVHLRPVSSLFLAVGLALADAHTEYLWLYMLAVNTATAFVVFHVFRSMISNVKLCFTGTIAVVVSRFGYYAYGQYMGVMEQTSTVMTVLVLYHVLKSVTTDRPVKHTVLALVFTLLAMLCHERYVTLAVLVILSAPLVNDTWKKKAVLLSAAIIGLFALLGLRTLMLGAHAMSGTGGTSVADTFNLKQALTFLFQGCLFLFGLNTGPQHLAGFRFTELPRTMLIPLAIFLLCIVLYIWWAFRNKNLLRKWKQYFLMIAFVGGAMAGGCITFRLEMRWLYTSYIGMILIILMLIQDCGSSELIKKKILPIVLFACLIIVELFYHGGYPLIYFSHPQSAYNQIYELTIRKNNHQSLAGKRVTVICDYANGSSHITENELSMFYLTYATEMGYGPPEVNLYTSIQEYDFSKPADIILSIDWVDDWIHDEPEVKDITDEFWQIYESSRPVGNDIRSAAELTGFSWWEGPDQQFIWTGSYASMRIATGENGAATLSASMKSYNLPNNLKVSFNGEVLYTFPLNEQNVELTFQLPAGVEGIVSFELDSAISPFEQGESDDRRALGLCISEFRID